MTLAAVGTYVSGGSGPAGDLRPVVVARRDVVEGHVLRADDVAVVHAPARVPSATSFDRVEDVVGRTVIGPIARGDLLQASGLTVDRPRGDREVLLHVPSDHVAISRLRPGERVDVYSTGDDGTALVLADGEVREVLTADDASLVDTRDIGLVVSVDTVDRVSRLVHAARTTELTIVRATSGRAAAT